MLEELRELFFSISDLRNEIGNLERSPLTIVRGPPDPILYIIRIEASLELVAQAFSRVSAALYPTLTVENEALPLEEYLVLLSRQPRLRELCVDALDAMAISAEFLKSRIYGSVSFPGQAQQEALERLPDILQEIYSQLRASYE